MYNKKSTVLLSEKHFRPRKFNNYDSIILKICNISLLRNLAYTNVHYRKQQVNYIDTY